METVEEELLARSLDFMERSHKADKPFFLWHNSTRMHVWTHLSDQWANKSGHGLFADGMMELDYVVGELLKKLDELGIADNTIVMFTSDNGTQIRSWPDGGNHPFKGEKGNTTYYPRAGHRPKRVCSDNRRDQFNPVYSPNCCEQK